jgi:predicted kinase
VKITIIVGLPGSGKSHLGRRMVEGDEDAIFLDDLSVIGGIDELQRTISVLGPDHIVIADAFLCRSHDRAKAREWLRGNAPGCEVEWVYFENDPSKCRANVLRRNSGGDARQVDGLIGALSPIYAVPDGVEVIGVHVEGGM